MFLSGQGQCLFLNILNIPLGKKHSTWKGPGAGEGLAGWRKEEVIVLGQGEQGGEGQGTGVAKVGLWVTAETVGRSHFDNDDTFSGPVPVKTHSGLQPSAL